MEREVARYTRQKIANNQAVGELEHPSGPQINLDRVSHKIISLVSEGNNWIGKAKIIDTPVGKIVKNLIDEGIKFGVSSRGLGSVKNTNGINEVCEDFYLITPADIVSDPSGPDCFVTSIMENKEWVYENGKFIEKEREIKETINKLSNSTTDKKLKEQNLMFIVDYLLAKL